MSAPAPPYPPQECGASTVSLFILQGHSIVELWTCTRDTGHGPPHEQEVNGKIGERRWTE